MLLTAHSAKGLEFDTVFVPRIRAPHGYPNSRVDEEEGLPAHLLDRMGDARSAKDRRAAEERRLFYVAATRAERRLVLLAAKRKSRTKNTDYFNEISMDDPCKGIVNSKTSDEVLQAAAELGVKLSTRTPLDEAATGLTPLGPEDRREVLDAGRRVPSTWRTGPRPRPRTSRAPRRPWPPRPRNSRSRPTSRPTAQRPRGRLTAAPGLTRPRTRRTSPSRSGAGRTTAISPRPSSGRSRPRST
jgi:ATP-dependent exoDNAse (exonuclease V) beta subunit